MAGQNPIILIPARLASTRLPNKPLAPIGGLAMIVQVALQINDNIMGALFIDRLQRRVNAVGPRWQRRIGEHRFAAGRLHSLGNLGLGRRHNDAAAIGFLRAL